MRYKFKAWDKQKKKWNDRVLCGCDSDGSDYICNLVWDEEINDWNHFDEGCGTIVQWTGLKDRNGVEIYEGYIIGVESHGVNRYEHRVICYDIHQAKYKAVPVGAYFVNAGNGGWTGFDIRDCEILGNVYEHHHLLESTI